MEAHENEFKILMNTIAKVEQIRSKQNIIYDIVEGLNDELHTYRTELATLNTSFMAEIKNICMLSKKVDLNPSEEEFLDEYINRLLGS